MNTEQNERWAKMFGYQRVPVDRMFPEQGYFDYPDFTALDGPYIGPAIKELLDAGHHLTRGCGERGDKEGTYRWTKFGCQSHQFNSALAVHADLGICTLLALEAKRATERETEGA